MSKNLSLEINHQERHNIKVNPLESKRYGNVPFSTSFWVETVKKVSTLREDPLKEF